MWDSCQQSDCKFSVASVYCTKVVNHAKGLSGDQTLYLWVALNQWENILYKLQPLSPLKPSNAPYLHVLPYSHLFPVLKGNTCFSAYIGNRKHLQHQKELLVDEKLCLFYSYSAERYANPFMWSNYCGWATIIYWRKLLEKNIAWVSDISAFIKRSVILAGINCI